MKSTVEPEEGNKVKVVVSFTEDEPEFQAAVADTWVEISKQVRIPGFRAGKAPRKILEKQLGARSRATSPSPPSSRPVRSLSWAATTA